MAGGQTRPVVDLEEIRQKFELYRWLRERIDEMQQQADEVREEIETFLGDAELAQLDGEPVIRWSRFKTSRVDVKRLRAEAPELAERYTTTTEVRKFELIKDNRS